ncbi:MAG: sulfate ABC transporter substrate-binding protein [Candidatus Krumholzibacteriia bacterium]
MPLALLVALLSCARRKAAAPPPAGDTLVLAAYTVPKEAYTDAIIPAFREHWRRKTGREVDVQQSYEASGAQARAVAGGFEADVVALSLEGDVDKVTEAGLITHDWRARPWGGFITRSLVVIGIRPGNPKNIRDWSDLTRPDIEVLYPNPKTSGGAMWCVNAIYGAGLKQSEAATGAPDPAVARDLLKRIQARVKVMDKSGRESVTTFERGIGDAVITYENEVLLRGLQGRPMPFVIPPATILIENPVAVVDAYADRHGARAVAEEFVQFLHGDLAQRAFARYGFRPASPAIMREVADRYPAAPLQFDMGLLGGWTRAREMLYGPHGVWTLVTQELGQGR